MVDLLAAVAAGIVEGDYTNWTKKWGKSLPEDPGADSELMFHVDELNEVINVLWKNLANHVRFGVFNISDFSAVFTSADDSDYVKDSNYWSWEYGIVYGMSALYRGSPSRAVQSYFLLARDGEGVIEVWRGGSSALWSRNITDDLTGGKVKYGLISASGKYILISIATTKELILYEGVYNI